MTSVADNRFRLTIWMNTPSFYQEDLFLALIEDGIPLHVVYSKTMSQERLDLGWQVQLTNYEYTFLSRAKPVRHALQLAKEAKDNVNIIGGLWAKSPFMAALVRLVASGSFTIVYGEAQNPIIRRSGLKCLLQQLYGHWISQHPNVYVLAVSSLAAPFFQSLGFSWDRVIPFGYFRKVDKPVGLETRPTDNFKLVFVGQLIKRKGVDLLIRAVFPLLESFPQLILEIIGDGPYRPELESLVRGAAIGHRIRFVGAVPSIEVAGRIARARLLVLPSYWDGWGVVVNEALSLGVPALVSDCCGARDLIEATGAGVVFTAGDEAQLRSKVLAFLERPEMYRQACERALRIGQMIQPAMMARYLHENIARIQSGQEITSQLPWLSSNIGGEVFTPL